MKNPPQSIVSSSGLLFYRTTDPSDKVIEYKANAHSFRYTLFYSPVSKVWTVDQYYVTSDGSLWDPRRLDSVGRQISSPRSPSKGFKTLRGALRHAGAQSKENISSAQHKREIDENQRRVSTPSQMTSKQKLDIRMQAHREGFTANTDNEIKQYLQMKDLKVNRGATLKNLKPPPKGKTKGRKSKPLTQESLNKGRG